MVALGGYRDGRFAPVYSVIEDILKLVGLVAIAGGGLTGIAFALFRAFGERWLDAKFQQRLETFKHEQQKEIERLRFKINTLFDRATKLHQREFEVLPEAWAKLNDAYWKALALVHPFQQYPDVNRMSEQHFNDWIEGCQLAQWEKQELRDADDRTAYYIKQVGGHRLWDAQSVSREAHVYLLKNGIFLPFPLKGKFGSLDSLVWEALTEYEINRQENIRPQPREKSDALRQGGSALLMDIESDVQKRLWVTQDEDDETKER